MEEKLKKDQFSSVLIPMVVTTRAAIHGAEITKSPWKITSQEMELHRKVRCGAVRCAGGPEGFEQAILCNVSREDMGRQWVYCQI